MRITTMAAALAVCLCIGSADAAPITLIDYTSGAASPGNGAFFSDPAGVVAPAGVSVNAAGAINQNGNGRALAAADQNDTIDFTDLTDITENKGVEISGWGNYRWTYIGGNNALGFLENGGRLGKANAANDGQVFANSGPYILVSDAYSEGSLGDAGDSYDLSLLTGSDNGSFDLETFLVLDDTTFVSIDDRNISSTGETVSLSGTIGSSYSTMRVVFAVDAPNGSRGLIDDVSLAVTSAIPEPSTVALSMLALAGLGFRRRLA
ncbi:PEP-CTERM motif protein [Planctomycetes bacterium MalM25]|nr:PEP-CTERM motif protein [Planctomycetes bacterium MalM25]